MKPNAEPTTNERIALEDTWRLVQGTDLGALEWRHHGLGMLQGEIDETTRVHLWHPDLRTIPLEGYRDVHDHRFTLESTVLVGKIWDVQYLVTPTFVGEGVTDAWEIKHAKIQLAEDRTRVIDTGAPEGSPNTKWIGRVNVVEMHPRLYQSGESYVVPRRQWHTTRIEGFALTLVRRRDFDDKPARILGKGFSAIIKHADEDPARVSHQALMDRVVAHAKEMVR